MSRRNSTEKDLRQVISERMNRLSWNHLDVRNELMRIRGIPKDKENSKNLIQGAKNAAGLKVDLHLSSFVLLIAALGGEVLVSFPDEDSPDWKIPLEIAEDFPTLGTRLCRKGRVRRKSGTEISSSPPPPPSSLESA